jgi:ribonuclease J
MPQSVTLTPLGGLGEIGMNCMLLETESSMIMIDCGLMFPDAVLYGVDVVIPRLDTILEKRDKLKGIVLTHGHEDHIGGLPWLLPAVKAPIYGSQFTLSLVNKKLVEHDLTESTTLVPVHPRERIGIGDFHVNFFPVCHSIIHGYGLGIETPAGKIVHTGDFKIDRNPLNGHFTDLDAFRRFAGDGATLLLSDSTNVEREGFSLTEREIKGSLTEIFQKAEGRILVTLFSTHIQRMQEIFDLARDHGRRVAVDGRSLAANIEIARDLGYLDFSDENYCTLEELPSLADRNAVLMLTGSQGEPLSALTRVSRGEHRRISIHPGDTVIMSSRFIPGNTRAITRVINDLYRLGAEVLYERVQAIHASGHAHQEELKIMMDAVRPKFFVPVHGEYRHLYKHAQLAKKWGVAPERALIMEDGHPLTLFADGGFRLEESVCAESILVDGKGVGDVGQTVLRERQILGGEGLVIVLLVLDGETGHIVFGPDLLSKGFIFEQQFSHVLEDAKCLILDIFEAMPEEERPHLEDRIRSTLRRFFRKVLDRDPIVLPLVIEV